MRSGQLFPTWREPRVFLVFFTLWCAACGGSTAVTEVVGPSDARCQISLTAQLSSIPPDGSELTVQIESARECSWEARTEADWAQLSMTAGQGPATLAVTVASNPRALTRSTSIVVNNQRLALSQEARPCRFTLSSTSADVSADEGRVTVEVDTLEGCAWRASTTTSWIRVPGDERTGSGSVVMTVQGNDDGDGRRGLVTLGGQPFTIAQSGRDASAPGPAAPSSCTPSVEPAALDVPSTAQSHSVDLEIGPGCNWTAVSNDSWVSLTSPRSGSGEARVQFTVSANTGTAARTGSLTVAGQRSRSGNSLPRRRSRALTP